MYIVIFDTIITNINLTLVSELYQMKQRDSLLYHLREMIFL